MFGVASVARCGLVMVALLGWVLAASSALAESRASVAARFQRIDSSLGLSQDSAMSLAQDHRGYLWVGTQDGLNRYDGRDMITFRAHAGDGALGGNWISQLLHDPRGWLWVGTSSGLYRHDYLSERFEPMPLADEAGGYVYAIFRAADGAIWIGSDHGLQRWDPERGRQDWPAAGQSLPVDLPDRRIRAIAQGRHGRLWLGTTEGLRQFDPRRGEFLPSPAALRDLGEPINALLVDRMGRLWIAADASGTWRYPDLEGAAAQHVADSAGQRSYALLQTQDGRLWIGTEEGVLALSEQASVAEQGVAERYLHRAHDPASIGRGRVRALLDGGADGLWFGTWDGGANGLHPERARLLSFTPDSLGMEDLLHPSVLSVAADQRGLWLGGVRGIYRMDPDSLALQRLPGSDALSAYALGWDGDTLLFGADHGLLGFDPERGQVGQALGWRQLDSARIRRLLLDGERLWLYASPLGVHVFEDRSQAPVAVHPFAGAVNQIAVLEPNHVLALASDGLYWFSRDGRRLEHVHRFGSDAQGRLLAGRPSGLLRAEDGRYWISLYGAGLAEMLWQPQQPPEAATFPLRLTPPRLANGGVNSLLGDARQRLWLTTDRGVSRYDPATDEVINFDRQDGALTRGYYFSAAAALGTRWFGFGSKDGFTVFDPQLNLPKRTLRAPRLSAVERDGVLLGTAGGSDASPELPVAPAELESWTLQPGQANSLLFRFASPELVAPEQLRYRYRMDGLDRDWSEVPAQRAFASYRNLPPGNYTLRLQALARDGRSSPERQFLLQQLPHWWQTWWAHTAALLLLGLAGMLAYRLRVHRLHLIQAQLAQQVAERTQVAEQARVRAEQALVELKAAQQELVRAEKLSALGQLVSGVAHEVNTPLGVAVTASSHLSSAVRSLRRKLQAGQIGRREFEEFMAASEEASDLVQRNLERASELIRSFKQVSVDRSSDGRREFELGGFLAELTASLRLLWKHRPVFLQIDCAPQLHLDSFPGALGQVLTNLVQNALLHAFEEGAGGQMRIAARALSPERILLEFADDGRGMSAEDARRVFEPFFTTRRGRGGTGLGLHIVHNLVCEKLGGSIRLHSAPGQGSRFEIELPTRAPEG
jgi:signal transduction histidine kinase/ligand-binding sensor domain-containing protein